MASVINRPNGHRWIQFTSGNDQRKTIRLGKLAKRDAEAIKSKVEDILSAKLSKQAIPSETAKWLADLEDNLFAKLAAVGLIKPRDSSILGVFLEAYVEGRSDVKPNTIKKYASTKRKLIEFFGNDRELRSIHQGDADDWRRWLVDNGHRSGKTKKDQQRESKQIVENTVRKHIAVAKVFFAGAVRRKLIESNPFADQVSSILANTSREYFVTLAEAQAVLDACPDAEWRLLFALARFGGLRVPSEPLSLTWSDIDWDRQRLRIQSPKTERQGKPFRTIPIFPELLPHLQEVFEQAEEGSTFVINRYRSNEQNLRTQLQRIVIAAGLTPWPKIWQNLRSTRETELVEVFPVHVVCDWLGNSKAVAMKHYLQTTNEHFEKAKQNPKQSLSERASQQKSDFSRIQEKAGFDARCLPLSNAKIAEAGLEPARG